MASCTGEFVLILDADFVPAPDMLRKTVHFFTDPKVGMIQTRWGHLNRTYSVLTRVQAQLRAKVPWASARKAPKNPPLARHGARRWRRCSLGLRGHPHAR